jgi:hypothetical protein
METFTVKSRQKIRARLKAGKTVHMDAVDSSDEEDAPAKKKVKSEEDAPTKKGADEEDDDEPRKWDAGERISLNNANGEAMCHGEVLDGEPNLAELFGEDHKYVRTSQQNPNWWVHVRVSHPTNNSNCVLEVDYVFDHEGGALSKTQRSIKNLCDLEEGVIIWWEYVASRMIAPLKRKQQPAAKHGQKRR